MWYLLVVALLVPLAIAAVLLGGRAKTAGAVNQDPDQLFTGRVLRWTGVLLALAVVVLSAFRTVHQIPAGHVGVVYAFGDITGQLGEGLQTTAPWQSVKVASTQTQRERFQKIDAFSQETQDVFITATLNYQVEADTIQTLYRTIGVSWFDRLVEARVLQIFKDTTVRYKSVEIAPAREQIRRAVRDRLRAELQPFSIDVVDLLIDNIDFRPEFKTSIERKQIATQDAQTAQNRVAQAKFEAQQKVEAARGLAASTLIKAEAQAKANTLLNRSLTDQIIRYETIQRLAPNVQTILVPSDSNFILPQSFLGGTDKP